MTARGGMKVTNCGLCGSGNLAKILDMGEQPLPERHDDPRRYPLVLLECQDCGLVQLSYVADQREVFPPGHVYATGNTRALRDHFASLAASLSADLPPGALVVDIGASDGTFLSCFPDHLVRVGVEPTRQADKAAAKGLEIWPEFFTSVTAWRLRAELGAARLVTASNVLAHVTDPHDVVAGIAHLLADDGILVAENHDIRSVLDGLQIDAVYAEHSFYWSVATFSRLLAAHGLAVLEVRPVPTHGGSFRTYARKTSREPLQVRADAAAKALRVLLDGVTQEGPVYGIGAATRATPLIHFARIAPYISCVCEVASSEKIGLTMPGTTIKVVDEVRLIEDQPPYALLFSWHVAGSIIPKLRQMGYRGKFIVPLPVPRILED